LFYASSRNLNPAVSQDDFLRGLRGSHDDFLRGWIGGKHYQRKRAPFLLWLFNEQGWGELRVILTDGLIKRETGQQVFMREVRYYYTSRSHPALVKARSLFPEAEVIPMVDRVPDGIIRFEEVVQE
jgi:hypothetical protein